MGWLRKKYKQAKAAVKKWLAPAVAIITAIVLFPIIGPMGALAAGAVAGAATHYTMGMASSSSFDIPDYSGNEADGASSMNQGILVNKAGTNNSIPVVYGTRKLGGTRVFMSTDGSTNEYLYIAMVFAEGEINAFKELIFDDKLVAGGSYGGDPTTGVNNPAYSDGGRLQYELQTGSAGQQSPDWFNQNGWSNSHNLSGLAVGYFKLKWVNPDPATPGVDQQKINDANPYSGVPLIHVVVQGKKVPNATSYVDGASTAYASMPKSYSTNPADHMLDYLLNPIFGRGLENDRIGFTSFKTAANKFNTSVNYKTNGTGKIMELNQVVLVNRTMLQNVQTMLQNMRSGMPYIQGKFNLKLLDSGHASLPSGAPVIAFPVTERELIGGLVVDGLGHRDQYNQVRAVFPDPSNNWEINEIVYPAVNSAVDEAFLAEDNDRRLTKEISLEGITNGNIAGDVASIVLLNSRKKKMVNFTATAELHNTVVGDIITLTYPSLGISAAQYRITSHQITPDYTVKITALEHESTTYDFTNTNVHIPKAVSISSNDQYQNSGNVTSGNPYYPGPKSQNAYISTITNVNFSMCELTIVSATDVSQYDIMRVDQIGAGAGAPSNPSSFTSTSFQKSSGAFVSPQGIVVQKWNNQYVWFRIVYIKQDNTEVFGPWKRTPNPQPIAVPLIQAP
jgi:hypothetical protein